MCRSSGWASKYCTWRALSSSCKRRARRGRGRRQVGQRFRRARLHATHLAAARTSRFCRFEICSKVRFCDMRRPRGAQELSACLSPPLRTAARCRADPRTRNRGTCPCPSRLPACLSAQPSSATLAPATAATTGVTLLRPACVATLPHIGRDREGSASPRNAPLCSAGHTAQRRREGTAMALEVAVLGCEFQGAGEYFVVAQLNGSRKVRQGWPFCSGGAAALTPVGAAPHGNQPAGPQACLPRELLLLPPP